MSGTAIGARASVPITRYLCDGVISIETVAGSEVSAFPPSRS